jgi:hypothetical protein
MGLFSTGNALCQLPVDESPLALLALTFALALASASKGMLLGALCRRSKQAGPRTTPGLVWLGIGRNGAPGTRMVNGHVSPQAVIGLMLQTFA